jgi:asparagine synthase (glutamine-hydrolysing)
LRARFRRALHIQPRGEALPPWLDAGFAREQSVVDRWERYRSIEPEIHPARPQAYNLLRGPGWQRLSEYTDPAAMRVPLEYRNPYLDVRVVRYLLRVPPMPWFAEKEILRRAAIGKLPENVRTRRKTPLREDPTHVLMTRQAEELAARVERVAELDAFVDRRRLAAAIRDPNRTPFTSFLACFPIALAYWFEWTARDPLIIQANDREAGPR